MSHIEIEVGEARVVLGSEVDSATTHGTTPHYRARDLMDATATALLAVNDPQSVAWAHALFDLTKGPS